MKTIKVLAVIAILFHPLITLFAQGSGKANLRADIETLNDLRDMQISVIDLASKDVLKREEVSNRFFYSLPLNGKYMLHFKKAGHPTTRLIVHTNAPEAPGYNIHFKLNLKNPQPYMESGISISAGTISFNEASGSFELKEPESGNASLCAITFQARVAEPATF
ncbi:MAG: hypothetical protein JNJ99_11680 [Crocinitomicaceae bacterium]|nr:hypothetical protein [Crocinitomicaceae bacterium]